METIKGILCIVYLIFGYMAVNNTIYANKIVIYTDTGKFILKKILLAFFLGWILIPVWLIKSAISK